MNCGNENVIVKEAPGSGTGDTVVQTSDGRVWVNDYYPSASLPTGSTRGTRTGSIIKD